MAGLFNSLLGGCMNSPQGNQSGLYNNTTSTAGQLVGGGGGMGGAIQAGQVPYQLQLGARAATPESKLVVGSMDFFQISNGWLVNFQGEKTYCETVEDIGVFITSRLMIAACQQGGE